MAMIFRLSTHAVPEHKRVEFWGAALLAELKSVCQVAPRGKAPFQAGMTMVRFGPVNLYLLEGSGYTMSRSGPGEHGRVSFLCQLEGKCTLTDPQRSARLGPGSLCLVPPDCDLVVDREGPFRQVLLQARAEHLDESFPRWPELATTAIDANSPGMRSLLDLLNFAISHCETLDVGSRERLGTTAMCLINKVLYHASSPQHTERSPKPRRCTGLAALHRQRIEKFIHENLRDPELSVAKIAEELGISTRYVHKLYEGESVQLMQRVLSQRLCECQRDIAQRGSRSISEIAYSWGFNSTAHFSRAFKQRFGVRPSDL
jgi:AraC family transcriptional activator of tynA and feaB